MATPTSAANLLPDTYTGECVPESSITFAFVVAKLVETYEPLRQAIAMDGEKIKEIRCEDISGTNGYTSRIYQFSLELETQNGAKHISVVLKVFSQQRMESILRLFLPEESMSGDITTALRQFSNIHNRECDFYTGFGSLGLLPLPEVYYVQRLDFDASDGEKNGLIVMEDLSECTYLAPFDRCLGVSKVEAVVRHLAAFHAHLLGTLGEEDRERLLLPFRELLSDADLCGETTVRESLQRSMSILPGIEEPIRKLRKVLDKEYYSYCCRECPAQLGVPAVLVHGDLWSNNILWKKEGNGGIDEPAAFIDWQIAFAGNPMADIARVMACCDTELRRRTSPRMVQLYRDELQRLLRTAPNREKLTHTLTADSLMRLYELALIQQAMGFVLALPLFYQTWNTSESGKEKSERLKSRIADMLEDAVEMLQRVGPKWVVE